MSTSATREATNSESAAIWWVTVRVYDKQGRLQWRIPASQPPALIFRQSWGPRDQKNFFKTGPPAYLGVWMTPPPPPLCEGVDPPLSYVAFYPKSFLTKGHNTEQAEICSFSFWILFFAIDQLIEILKFTFLFREKKNIDPSWKSTFVSFWPNEQNSLEIKGNHKW